ncbi:MAG: site-2 protease family protein, partial [Thermoguttaceae bacterium]|nr:site-2 protease family protein [Thermoguttaceae bacterium]
DTHLQRSESVVAALQFGWDKTVDMMGLVFKFLRNVGKSVSAKALGGPVMIVGTAYAFTGTGDGLFLLFLCIIGANLAVVNFLPIPVLDGGHMVFLLYEAIFRRPPNENIQIILSYMGLFLLLALMFWVIGLDIFRCLGLL